MFSCGVEAFGVVENGDVLTFHEERERTLGSGISARHTFLLFYILDNRLFCLFVFVAIEPRKVCLMLCVLSTKCSKPDAFLMSSIVNGVIVSSQSALYLHWKRFEKIFSNLCREIEPGYDVTEGRAKLPQVLVVYRLSLTHFDLSTHHHQPHRHAAGMTILLYDSARFLTNKLTTSIQLS